MPQDQQPITQPALVDESYTHFFTSHPSISFFLGLALIGIWLIIFMPRLLSSLSSQTRHSLQQELLALDLKRGEIYRKLRSTHEIPHEAFDAEDGTAEYCTLRMAIQHARARLSRRDIAFHAKEMESVARNAELEKHIEKLRKELGKLKREKRGAVKVRFQGTVTVVDREAGKEGWKILKKDSSEEEGIYMEQDKDVEEETHWWDIDGVESSNMRSKQTSEGF